MSPTPGSCYWGAYLDTSVPIHFYGATDVNGVAWASGGNSYNLPGNTWDLMEAHAGKTMSLLNFGWGFRFGGFPTTLMNNIWSRGCIPAINMNWGADNVTGGVNSFTNTQIVAGNNDSNWQSFFSSAAAMGKPFFLLPCVEFNGAWTYEGGLQTDGTFTGASGNNPTNFISAWQHLYNIAQLEGATNCTWAWIPNAINPTALNIYDNIQDYYPGDGYVDWTGMDTFSYAYPLGTFTQNCQPTYNQITGHVSSTKPMMISQIAAAAADSVSDGVDNTAWINGMFSGLGSFPLVKAFMWFSWHNSNSKHNNEIEDPYVGTLPIAVASWASTANMAAAQAFTTGLTNSRYQPKFGAALTSGKVPIPPMGITLRGTPTKSNTTAAGTLTISVPAGTVAGDVLLVNVLVSGASDVPATPSGLTQIDNGAVAPSYATYYRVCDGTEPASYSWTVAALSAGTMRTYTGVDNTNPINAHGIQRNSSTASAIAPSITTTIDGCMLVFGAGAATSEASFTNPTGFANQTLQTSTGSAVTCDEVQTSQGATGTLTGTLATAQTNYASIVALAPQVVVASSFPSLGHLLVAKVL